MRLGDANCTLRCIADRQLDGIRFQAWLYEKFERLSKSLPQEEIMPTFEAQLRQDLRNYAVELRQVVYTICFDCLVGCTRLPIKWSVSMDEPAS